ncbi:uncharacterized protein LY89DRAFT_603422 [Mollisia scopiformis]|uniref:Zn(2)-C6 fungal-type domain-containing protein n=1 Tax=Mollisia scopiformis TaxID=149040 RepID=A0A132B279_MOLSC|nr:uncharacterized protein LY89DRAFT_603422 [Mollisia scopiformis]KUJ06421.1 hypothetical protein LY89DRAFT_603422 [Mollisia scopiformis]
MPRVARGQRKRAYKPKTRTGLRHVKCGEERPSCDKCTSTGRTCDGYDFTAEEPSSSRSSSTHSLVPTLGTSPSSSIVANDREQRSFHFFRQTTVAHLSGCFSEDVWDNLVLQTSHHEPAIRHAIIALGSLHERYVTHAALINRQDALDDFALQQYNLAIRSLMEPLSRKKRLSVDVMQGSYGPAIAHIRSGNKILHELQYDETNKEYSHHTLEVSRNPYVPTNVVEDLFLRLDFQATQMVGEHSWEFYGKSSRTLQKLTPPRTFTALSMAREQFILCWHRCSFLLHELDQNLESPDIMALFATWQKTSSGIVDAWNAAFESFLEENEDKLSENEKRGAAIMKILKATGFMALRNAHPTAHDQVKWDQFRDQYEEIVDLAEGIISSSAGIPQFSLDMGIVGPLYEVTARCRDPFVRRRAISLLKSAQRQEGVWNSFLTATVAERVVQIEEGGLGEVNCCEDIPDWARISSVAPTFDHMGRRAILRYTRPGSKHSMVRQPYEEVIEW